MGRKFEDDEYIVVKINDITGIREGEEKEIEAPLHFPKGEENPNRPKTVAIRIKRLPNGEYAFGPGERHR
jgi:hypothetical protein